MPRFLAGEMTDQANIAQPKENIIVKTHCDGAVLCQAWVLWPVIIFVCYGFAAVFGTLFGNVKMRCSCTLNAINLKK